MVRVAPTSACRSARLASTPKLTEWSYLDAFKEERDRDAQRLAQSVELAARLLAFLNL